MGVGLRGDGEGGAEGEGGEVSAVWGGGDVDVVGMGRRGLRGLGFLVGFPGWRRGKGERL